MNGAKEQLKQDICKTFETHKSRYYVPGENAEYTNKELHDYIASLIKLEDIRKYNGNLSKTEYRKLLHKQNPSKVNE